MRRLAYVLGIYLLAACNTVPITGRRQLNLLPGSQMRAMATDQYQQFISNAQVIKNTENAQMLKTVGARIAGAVEAYLIEQGDEELIEDFNWEFNLVGENTVNAWAMPGGKVVFYQGIMPICEDANGVAVVMGHEVAHAIARHGNERMSQGLATQAGGIALSVALKDKPEQTQQLFMAAYGIGAQVGLMLPYSRLHESEADKLGLYFMAMAGYNPKEAPDFWTRMSKQSGGASPPEFLSTHPSHETRIENLNDWMPKAMKYYNQAQKAGL